MMLRCVFLLLFSSLTVLAEDLPPVFAKWIADQKSMPRDVHVTFVQERSSPVLKQPVKTEGRFWKMRDGRFRWELGSPATTIVIFDREKVFLKESKDAAWETLKPDDRRAPPWMRIMSGRNDDPKALTETFSVRVSEEGAGYATITLVPRPLLLKKHLRQIDMQIEPGGRRMFLLRIVQGDNSMLSMTFSPPKDVGDVAGLFKP